MKGCNIGNTGDSLDSAQCFGAGGLRSNEEADNCRVVPEVDEDVGLRNLTAKDGSNTLGGVLDALPGCNPIQFGPQLATKQTCKVATVSLHGGLGASLGDSGAKKTTPAQFSGSRATDDALLIATISATKSLDSLPATGTAAPTPSSTSSPDGLKLPPRWRYSGCFSDQIDPRSLGKQGEWWGQAITSTNCVAHCDSIGLSIAGTEDGGQCFCGNQLQDSSPAPGQCNRPCLGDSGEICGGLGALSVFRKSGSGKGRRAHRRSLFFGA